MEGLQHTALPRIWGWALLYSLALLAVKHQASLQNNSYSIATEQQYPGTTTN